MVSEAFTPLLGSNCRAFAVGFLAAFKFVASIIPMAAMISFFILSSKIVFTFFSYHSAHTLVHKGEVWSSFGCIHAVVSTKILYV